MPSILTIPVKLQVAQISCYLSSQDANKKAIFQGGTIKPMQPLYLRVMTDIVQWQYDHNQSDATLTSNTNFLYDLCASQQFAALNILNGSGGGSTVNPSTGSLVYVDVQFTIGGAGSPMNAGDTTLTISAQGIYINTFNIYVDGVKLPIGVSDRLSYTYTQTLTTLTLTFNDQAYTNQVYNYTFTKLVS